MHYTKLGAPNWAKNSVRYREIFPWDTISPYQSQKIKIRIQYLDISYLVMSHDKGYDITIYRDVSCDITPNHLETPGKYKFNENPPPRCGLLLFLSTLSLPSSWLVLRFAFFVVLLLSTSWIHHTTDRTTSRQQPRPLRTRRAPWDHVCFSFIFHLLFFSFLFFSFFPSLFLLDTCYLALLSNCKVPDIILFLTQSGISVWDFVVVER